MCISSSYYSQLYTSGVPQNLYIMAPKGAGSAKNAKTVKKPKGSPSGSEDIQNLVAPTTPECPEVVVLGEPSGLLGAMAGPTQPAPSYVTEEMLASTLGGLERRMAALITASLSGKKRVRSPSPRSESLEEDILSD